MTIRVRSISAEEAQVLDRWQRSDNVVRYRRARIFRLSETGWMPEAIADDLGVHVETVRQTLQAFNEGGVDTIVTQPRSGGR